MTAEELAKHIEEIAPIVTYVADDMTDGLPLTDEELKALGIADSAIKLGQFGCDASGDPWASAAAALIAALPIVQVVALVESWRSTRITADEMDVIVGPLGPGVVVEGRG